MDTGHNIINTETQDKEKEYKRKSQALEVWKRLLRNKAAIIGLVILIALILVAIFADAIVSYDVVIKQNVANRLQYPSKEHWFGTDQLGRDIFARIIHGSRISLFVGVFSVTGSLVVGGIFGAMAGFYGGKIDSVIMRCTDVLLAIPGTLLAITIVAALGPNMTNLVIALTISGVPGFARIIKAAVITVKDQEYIEAARAIGAKDATIILSDVLPNCMAPIIVQVTLKVAGTILATAGLSFLGLGAQPPTPEWGSMLSGGRTFIRDYSYITIFPGLAIIITVLSLNLLGDGLRDALDPRLK